MTIDEAFATWERSRTSTDHIRELRGGGQDEAFRAGAEWAIRELFDAVRYRTCECPEDVRQLANAAGFDLDKEANQ